MTDNPINTELHPQLMALSWLKSTQLPDISVLFFVLWFSPQGHLPDEPAGKVCDPSLLARWSFMYSVIITGLTHELCVILLEISTSQILLTLQG